MLPCKSPLPQKWLLLVEVSDSTLRYDLTTKAALYATAEISEYWIVDIENRKIYVHQSPQNGFYQSVIEYVEGQIIAPLAAPHSPVRVENLLP